MPRHEMSLMNEHGDTKVHWDPMDPASVDTARTVFDTYLAQRFLAFSMDPSGTKGEPLAAFDPTARSILFVPPMAGG